MVNVPLLTVRPWNGIGTSLTMSTLPSREPREMTSTLLVTLMHTDSRHVLVNVLPAHMTVFVPMACASTCLTRKFPLLQSHLHWQQQGILKNKKDVIKFFKSYGLADFISFPKSCFIPFGSKHDNLILIGKDFSGFYPEI
jgi:hypothetical protein